MSFNPGVDPTCLRFGKGFNVLGKKRPNFNSPPHISRSLLNVYAVVNGLYGSLYSHANCLRL